MIILLPATRSLILATFTNGTDPVSPTCACTLPFTGLELGLISHAAELMRRQKLLTLPLALGPGSAACLSACC